VSANIMLLPEAVRHSLISFRNELHQHGIRSRVTSTVRSSAKQERLYRLYQQGLTKYPVAPPGRSLHEHGKAVDMVITPQSQLPLAASIGRRHGFKWAGVRDTVHYSYVLPIGPVLKGIRRIFRGRSASKPRIIASKEAGWQVGKGPRKQISDIPPHCK